MELLQTGALERTIRLDPRTKIIMLIAVSSVLLVGGEGAIAYIAQTCMLALPFLLIAISGRMAAAIALAAAYVISWALVLFAVPNLVGAANVLVVASCMIASRFLPTIAMAYFVFATTTVSEFTAAMERMHAPSWITIPLSVLFRFFPTLGQEAQCVQMAMRMRGIGIRRSGLVGAVEYRLVPVITSAVRIGEDLSAAALVRGLGAPTPRTNVCRIGFGVIDLIFIALCILALGVIAAGGVW